MFDNTTWAHYPDLEGRVALVTGGSGEVGAATCLALAATGARVAVNGRRVDRIDAVVKTIEAIGGTAIAAPGDVTDEAGLTDVRKRVEQHLGPVEVLAAFAGGQGRPVPTTDLAPDRWSEVLTSDLTSVYLTVHEFLPSMVERGGGSIITMSSTAGRQAGQANAAYAAAKAGVVMLTKHLANEYGRQGVRVNCLAPSAILTETLRQTVPPAQLDQLSASFPLGRIGRPDDVAQAATYLASGASSWITGVTVDLTGGRVIV